MSRRAKLGFEFTCQKCREPRESTKDREIYTANYVGPCGDSFCFASCTLSSCRPVRAHVCDDCEKLLKKERQ